MKILFCNIAWMHNYRGNQNGDDKPLNGGTWVNDTGDAHEKYNFNPVQLDNHNELYCLGFFETKSYNGKESNQMRIENISGCELCGNEEFVEDVLVIYCAKHPAHNFTTVVGWFNHATVYRHYQYAKLGEDDIQYYNAIAKTKDCVLLPLSQRARKTVWEVPRKNKGRTYGFGQANVWYASEDSKSLKDYLNRMEKQIIEYSGENLIIEE